jgi:hypothetical protein
MVTKPTCTTAPVRLPKPWNPSAAHSRVNIVSVTAQRIIGDLISIDALDEGILRRSPDQVCSLANRATSLKKPGSTFNRAGLFLE